MLPRTLFADGMVLVAGGLNSGAAVNNAYIYNAESKMFTATTGNLNTAARARRRLCCPTARS